ncbi:MAG: SurA N-terminal domain-containing protein [Haemophilus parainfluenzae]|nr:SurA N-terminal domain-containing protein [Haemophilus parainfluenzae]
MLIEKMHGLIGGMSGYLYGGNESFAAKVNGETISQQDFLNRYNQEFEARAQQEGENFLAKTDSAEFVTALRQNLIQRLVDQELIRQYAKELKLGVSDDMIKRAIVSDPNLQSNGKFDNARYQQLLTQNGLTSDTYAAILRNALTLEQMQNGLADSEFVVPAQVKDNAQVFFQKRIARLATLPLADEIAKQKVTDDTQIAQYYQENKAQFISQKLAHIQLSTEKEADAVYQELQKGADFAELAKTKSLDKLSGAQGGELGWVKDNELPKNFEDAALLLNVGQYSTPVNVDGAYHIILVQDRKERIAESRFQAVEKAVRAKAAESSDSLAAVAEAAGVKVEETDYFGKNNVPAALNFPNVTSAIFESDIANGGANSEPLTVGENEFVVVRVVDHKAEGLQSLDEAKSTIEQFLKREKADKVLTEKAEQAVKALSAEPTKLPAGISFSEPQTFTLVDNKDPVLYEGVFAIAKPQDGKAAYQVARNSKGDVVVVALERVEEPTLNEQELAKFSTQLVRARQGELQGQLMQALREKAQIEINTSFINQDDSEEGAAH